MSTCHGSCLTCSSAPFNNCLTCSSGLTLRYGTCNCDSAWQAQCTGQSNIRQLIQFLDMLIKLYIVGVMFLYVLRAKLPLSYRCWSGLCGLSLLVYNQLFYLQYQDELCLKSLAISNGPYFATYRVMKISTSHIFPTLCIILITIAFMLCLYFPFQVFHRKHNSFLDYITVEGMHLFDCAYFLSSKMMFFYIGKIIKQSSQLSTLYIVVVALYGLFILAAWIRLFYQYHNGTLQMFAYDTPIYLYTMLSPAAMVGLMISTSTTILVIIYCAPFALLVLILLLNRNMNIYTKPNIRFFIVEILMVGITLAFIFLDDQIKTYILLVIIFASILGISFEVWWLYTSGYDLALNKVYPQLDFEPQQQKKVFNEEKDGYF